MQRKPKIIEPGGGRHYPMGRMRAVFKADGEETREASSVSEWWLDPNTGGPPRHSHPEDHVFYIIEGVMSLELAGEWFDAPAGSYALVPGGTEHTFENRGTEHAGMISFNTPGGFEREAQPIADWFAENPLGDATD